MSSTNSVSIIHKKARVAREDFDLRAMSPAKAIRLSLARRADDLFDLPVVVKTLEQMRVTTDELTKELDEQGMLLLLDGANGRRGVASMDGNFISAVIEH
jgi:flagellar motor switch protein FliM